MKRSIALSLTLLILSPISFAQASSFKATLEQDANLHAWACEKGVSDKDLELALKSSDQKFLAIADFGKKADSKRLMVYNRETGEVTSHRVTHGLGNSPHQQEFQRFADHPGSRAVPSGVHVLTSELRRGRSQSETLLMKGQEPHNRDSAIRGITFGNCGVLSYRLDESTRALRSWGSMCLPRKESMEVMKKLKGAAVINFDSRRVDRDRVCPQVVPASAATDAPQEKSDAWFEKTERVVPMDSDIPQYRISPDGIVPEEGVE